MGPDTLPVAVLLGATVLLAAGVVGLAVGVRRRVEGRWSTVAWGALAFVASQVVRIPVLGVAGPFLPSPEAVIVLTVLTSGLAEEPARWLVLRFAARRDRRWRHGVLFGIGHGGIEALLLVGLQLIGTAALLMAGPALTDDLARQPGVAAAVEAQLDGVRAAPFEPVLALWERALAITFHVAASVLVVRSVRDGRVGPLLVAIVVHVAFNGAAVMAVTAGLTPVLVEVLLSVLTAGLVALIATERRRGIDGSEGGPREPMPPGLT